MDLAPRQDGEQRFLGQLRVGAVALAPAHRQIRPCRMPNGSECVTNRADTSTLQSTQPRSQKFQKHIIWSSVPHRHRILKDDAVDNRFDGGCHWVVFFCYFLKRILLWEVRGYVWICLRGYSAVKTSRDGAEWILNFPEDGMSTLTLHPPALRETAALSRSGTGSTGKLRNNHEQAES